MPDASPCLHPAEEARPNPGFLARACCVLRLAELAKKFCPPVKIAYSGVTPMAYRLGMALDHPSSQRALLTVGELVLDIAARTLTGPIGTSDLTVGAFAVLLALMKNQGAVLETGQLIEARWRPDLEPANAPTMIRMAVSRARSAIAQVGADPKQLRAVTAVGYRLGGAPRVVRAYTREQAAVLERIIATHPDQQLVAELSGAACILPAFADTHPAQTEQVAA